MTFRYTYVQNPLYPTIKITIGTHSAQLRVSPHPIFTQLKQLHLKQDQLNILVLTIITKGEVTLLPQKAAAFQNRCQQCFGIEPKLDLTQVGVGLMLGSNEQDTETLDNLKIGDVLKIVGVSFNQTGSKLHSKLLRKLKNYIKISKRAVHEKQILQTIAKAYKQSSNIEQNQQESSQVKAVQKQKKIRQKPQNLADNQDYSEGEKNKQADQIQIKKKRSNKPQKGLNTSSDQKDLEEIYARSIKNKNKVQDQKADELAKQSDKFLAAEKRNKVQKRNSRGKPVYNYSKQNDRRGGSFSKEKFDNRVLLGINGDTQSGWRQRNRPPRVPSRPFIDNGEQNIPPKQVKKQNLQKLADAPYVYSRASEQQSSEQNKQKTNEIHKEQKSSKRQEQPIKSNLKPQNQTTKQSSNAKQPNPQGITEIPVPKIDQIIKTSQGDMKLIYTFPKDGNLFKFAKLKDNFMIQINGNFWIQYNKNDLQITKGDDGYLRNSAIDIIDHGFMAEGLTINLDGNSNLEDGGETAGSPKIEDFTGNSSQFFHILTLQAYIPV